MVSNHRTAQVVLMGVGGVGGDLLRQMLREKERIAEQYGMAIEITGLMDSKSFLGEPGSALSHSELSNALRCKREGKTLSDCGGRQADSLDLAVRPFLGSNTILVDCTATERTVNALSECLRSGGAIALANKKPLTCDLETYQFLTSNPLKSRWETTVGSCLPVITTLARLKGCGDNLNKISGTLSGTLGFLMSGLEKGRRFGELVRQAHQDGATEPDPREDLSGMDVARKALILARGNGLKLELEQVSVEGLVPEDLNKGSVKDFLENVDQLDSEFQDRIKQAKSRSCTLRYLATIQGGDCRVGLAEVPVSSPLGQLSGNDNLLEIHSRLFSPQPLVIQGRGAGIEATAAGVLSDILELALVMRSD